MTRQELYLLREDYLQRNYTYQYVHHSNFNYDILANIMTINKSGKQKSKKSYNDVIIMCDTETSRKKLSKSTQSSKLPSGHTARENHVCAWTISIRAFNMNICTLYGHKPSTLVDTMEQIHYAMNGDITIMYFHNLSYDHWFIRQFLYRKFGYPKKQLNIKPHYPLFMRFNLGIELRDSLILSQKKLEKWAKDLQVEHLKSTGKWNYTKFRNQDTRFNKDELEYIEHDTLAGVECIQKTLDLYKKTITSIPYTLTGFIRMDVYKIGVIHNAKDLFLRIAPTYNQYIKLTKCFHGGYVHANRFEIDEMITEETHGLVQCFDFVSSYPFCMLAFKYPMEAFHETGDCSISHILSSNDEFAFIFKLCAYGVELREHDHVMPSLQFSKCIEGTCINPILDNGRIIAADYLEIYLTDVDLEVINEHYKFKGHMCTEVECAFKDYLPRWFTDYIFNLFVDKCKLSLTDDTVNYKVQKGKINGCYGMTVQKSISDVILEIFEDEYDEDGELLYTSGDYKRQTEEDDKKQKIHDQKEYEKYLKNRKSILPYHWGVFVTSYAFRNLHKLNKCVKPEEEGGLLLYNDTDSGYSVGWDHDKIEYYNKWCLDLLHANNYDSVVIDKHVFTLGIAEHKELSDDYTEFKVQGAKRYAGRCKKDGEIHITVAGVPKRGATCLKDDLNNFTKGFTFKGTETGKKAHIYFKSDIYIDEDGNETADSIDLVPNDYKLDSTDKFTLEDLLSEEIEVITYEDN